MDDILSVMRHAHDDTNGNQEQEQRGSKALPPPALATAWPGMARMQTLVWILTLTVEAKKPTPLTEVRVPAYGPAACK
jgi:hypothetical protein